MKIGRQVLSIIDRFANIVDMHFGRRGKWVIGVYKLTWLGYLGVGLERNEKERGKRVGISKRLCFGILFFLFVKQIVLSYLYGIFFFLFYLSNQNNRTPVPSFFFFI